MAILGGGPGGPVGAGNPFTGAASTLEHIGGGKYAAWTGEIISSNSNYSTALEFTSPSAAIVAEISWIVNRSALGAAADIAMRVTMNGAVVWDGITQLGYWIENPFKIIIPSYTEFKMEFMTSDTDDIIFTGVLVAEEV
tara:strand:+ start:223 stop:639 length:417 start_codon:yes stop_codon:yes gene_type:complete